ncbi:hypothetical protein [Nonomuraea sp. PA05]|uniref:hypothetical protein n=1 Tax=Nonomuraea sp. PA05 TaxID=2604466 RepID=UPI0011DD3100|nr:hypothetical protein [Nonomuraea sp. PA05]
MAVSLAFLLLGLAAISKWSTFAWLLHELGLVYPYWRWAAWVPTLITAGFCLRVTYGVWRYGEVLLRSATVGGLGWVLLLALDVVWWSR